jgi:hypothetical protein
MRLKLLVVVVATALPIARLRAETYHVDQACGDDGRSYPQADCQSPDGPNRTIQVALDPS